MEIKFEGKEVKKIIENYVVSNINSFYVVSNINCFSKAIVFESITAREEGYADIPTIIVEIKEAELKKVDSLKKTGEK